MILRSKYLICSSDKVVENGAISIQNGRIESAGRFSEVKRSHLGKITDLGEEILSPGFVSAHTHLELTGLKGSIGQFTSFTDWLLQVIGATANWSVDDYIDSTLEGASQSLEAGTTSLVETSGTDYATGALKQSGIRKFILFEVIGFDSNVEQKSSQILEERLARCREDDLLRTGIAPHAPYSVSGGLLKYCKRKANELDRVLSIHAAESAEEVGFIRDGKGTIREFKEKLGLPAEEWTGVGVPPVRYLSDLGLLDPRTLLVHCNYLSDEEIKIIAASKATVVYCPRSHRHFGHPTHPLERLLAAGVPLALGTDSLASNDSLSILDEMKFVKERYPRLSNAAIYAMGTTAAAEALGMAGEIGELKRDAHADVISIEPGQGDDTLERVLAGGSRVTLNIVGGRILFDRHAGLKGRVQH